ncbi:hypothetical protein AYX14_04449 [Cryptococcus neoformans]|nr:hypothetical protein AYX14_04449 [Cryptococcus neoformans var. grubii]
MLPPPKSAAVQIVRPPSPSSEKAKEKEKKHSPEKRETPQRICRNVMIYGTRTRVASTTIHRLEQTHPRPRKAAQPPTPPPRSPAHQPERSRP